MQLFESNKRIAIIYPWPGLGTFQPLLDASRLLVQNGFQVEIFTVNHPNFPPPPQANHPGISVITNRCDLFREEGVISPKWLFGRGGRLNHCFITKIYRPIWRNWLISDFRRHHKSLPYKCIIGMNRFGDGLFEAAFIANKINVPLINWSLELQFRAELKTKKQRRLKQKEIENSQKASFTIIQDQWRGQALAQENKLALTKMIFVPVARMGIARRKSNNSFRERLGISSELRVILCAGGIGWHNMNLEIIEAANRLPDNYIFIMQSAYRRYSTFDYQNMVINKANPNRVKVLFEPVPSEDYRALVDSADVGVAFYRACSPMSANTYMKGLDIIGLSSGKLADYLFSGLPVVVNKVTGPLDLVNSFNCGKSVNDAMEMEDALESIFQKYEYYSDNACRCFNERLELGRHFQSVIEKISSL